MLLKLDKLYLVFVEELLIKICPVVFDFKIKEGEMIQFFFFFFLVWKVNVLRND